MNKDNDVSDVYSEKSSSCAQIPPDEVSGGQRLQLTVRFLCSNVCGNLSYQIRLLGRVFYQGKTLFYRKLTAFDLVQDGLGVRRMILFGRFYRRLRSWGGELPVLAS
jgi:hypothetical protein